MMKAKYNKRPPSDDESGEESDLGADMLEMIDEEYLPTLKDTVTSNSYRTLFDKVNRVKGPSEPKRKRRKLNKKEPEALEEEYEDNFENANVSVKSLLPIKTKHGIVRQEMVVESADQPDQEELESEEGEFDGEGEAEEFTYDDGSIDISKPISATQLLAARNEVLRQKKLHIGTLSSGVLENPEEKITNLRTLLKIMDEESAEVFYTVRKLATVSLLEIFKDILPSYEIKKISSDGTKLKKDTFKLQKYEESLVLYYRKYLQKLEKNSLILVRKKGDSRKFNEEEIKIAELAVQAMCELLVAHPYFNYAQNLAQAVVPFLNNPRRNIREMVKDSVKTIFKEDKKEEITLKILRIVNNYLKSRAHNVNTDMLEILLVLNLRDINLDQEREQDKKQKKLMAHKQRVLQLSKRERKRKKKLQELEKELLETKAEENRQSKQQNLTEITKIVFGIYFRILKSSSNSKVIGVCLEGLARFSHCINIDFYVDLVNLLDKLLKEDWIGYREQLHCIQTVFSILSGQGEALTVDPTRFYTSLYKDLFKTDASKNQNFAIVLRIMNDALIKRRKKITHKRAAGFVKRLATLSLQLLHGDSLGCLSLIKAAMQLTRSLDILLDTDSSVGDGNFQPELDDPEYANATSTAMYELILLSKHYHPVVQKYANNIAFGVPATGVGSLPPEYGKCTPEELLRDFDMSKMAFNPAVPVPKNSSPSSKPQRHQFVDSSFEEYCESVVKDHVKKKGRLL